MGFVRAVKKKEYLVLMMPMTRCHFRAVRRYRKIDRYLGGNLDSAFHLCIMRLAQAYILCAYDRSLTQLKLLTSGLALKTWPT